MNNPQPAGPLAPTARGHGGLAQRRWRRWVMLSACVALVSCAPAPPGPAAPSLGPPNTAGATSAPAITVASAKAQPAANADLATSQAGIDSARSLVCRSHDDCATLAIGARACGGPEGYLAYSRTHSDVARLTQHLSRYNDLRKQAVQASGEMSTCQVPVDPGANCTTAGQCALLPARGLRGAPAAQIAPATRTAAAGARPSVVRLAKNAALHSRHWG